jgi:putative transcriptional regulator
MRYNTGQSENMELANNIRRLRFEKGEMTQQQLADRIGTSRMTVYSIESGKYVPSTVLALKLARVFEKPVEEIFHLEET